MCRVWRNETGMALNIRTEQPFHYGLKGSADIIGICNGFFIAIECKTGNATQSEQQKNFQAMIEKFGGFYVVIRSKEDALDFVRGVARCKRS